MKHYKIINNNYSIVQTGGGDLNILSYNVSWEAMTATTSGNLKLCTSDGVCKSNILDNVLYNIKKYKPDFALFQEAAEHQDIIELFDKNIYDFFVNTSDKETMLSLWNKKKFTQVKAFESEFEKHKEISTVLSFIKVEYYFL